MTGLLDRLASAPVARTVRRLTAVLGAIVLLGSLVAAGALASVRSTLATYREEVTPLVEASSRLRLAVAEVDNRMHLDIVEHTPRTHAAYATSLAEAHAALAETVRVSDPVEEHGGSVGLTSSPDEGTTFRLTFPRTGADAAVGGRGS